MEIPFFKYQGTGNDFIIIDNRLGNFRKNDTKLVALMCDRKFGIGADGLILLETDPKADFKMVYFNADGNESSMCGNGGRCLVAFAGKLGIINKSATFDAIDGIHQAQLLAKDYVKLKMKDVDNITLSQEAVFLDTGSPHHVAFVEGLADFDVFEKGKALRYGKYGPEGANINFVEQTGPDIFSVRTYERGVENETLSCGTGVTAVALAAFATQKTFSNEVTLQTPGGSLKVHFTKTGQGFENVYLEGPATLVFKGTFVC